MDDEKHYGRAEYWTIPTDGYGDCEDYALTKRKALFDAGFPLAVLRVAIVIASDGQRHSVLTVATDKGDFVLDNLRNDVVGWGDAGYRWIERQDSKDALRWVSINTTPAVANMPVPPRLTQVAATAAATQTDAISSAGQMQRQ